MLACSAAAIRCCVLTPGPTTDKIDCVCASALPLSDLWFINATFMSHMAATSGPIVDGDATDTSWLYVNGAFGYIGPSSKVYVDLPGTVERVLDASMIKLAPLWPASRAGHSSWMDPTGRFYIFGGVGTTLGVGPSMCAVKRDLWRYEPHSAVPYPADADVYEWQQLQSDASHDDDAPSSPLCTAAYYGGATYWEVIAPLPTWEVVAASGIPAPELVARSTQSPSARLHASTWSDASTGSMWLFGARRAPHRPAPLDFLSMADEYMLLEMPGGAYFAPVVNDLVLPPVLNAPVLNDLWKLDVNDTRTPPAKWTKVQGDEHADSSLFPVRPAPRASAVVFSLPHDQGTLVVAGKGWRRDDATGMNVIGQGMAVSDVWLRVAPP
jgi:hypothetical protein